MFGKGHMSHNMGSPIHAPAYWWITSLLCVDITLFLTREAGGEDPDHFFLDLPLGFFVLVAFCLLNTVIPTSRTSLQSHLQGHFTTLPTYFIFPLSLFCLRQQPSSCCNPCCSNRRQRCMPQNNGTMLSSRDVHKPRQSLWQKPCHLPCLVTYLKYHLVI